MQHGDGIAALPRNIKATITTDAHHDDHRPECALKVASTLQYVHHSKSKALSVLLLEAKELPPSLQFGCLAGPVCIDRRRNLVLVKLHRLESSSQILTRVYIVSAYLLGWTSGQKAWVGNDQRR